MGSVPHSEIKGSPQKAALIIGADVELVATVSDILSAWTLEFVADNVAALAAIEAQPFDLVLTGKRTSGNADVQLLRKIRNLRPHTRMIILTDQSTPADVIASMREGAFSYFSKPHSMESFAGMLRMAEEDPCWDDGIEIMTATPEWIRLAARCDTKTADRLLQFLHEIADLPDSERDDVAVAFREMLLNAMEYGAGFDPKQYVEISYLRARHMVLCRVKDPGKGFSLDEIHHAAVANPPDDPLRHQAYRDAKGMRAGGFGVLLARSLVDEVIYNEKGNEVLLIKYLNSVSKKTA